MPRKDVSAVLDLWSAYVRAKTALIKSGALRSLKAAEADLAEWLVAQLVEGELPASKSHPAYDVVSPGKRIQVKSLCKASDNPNGYIVQPKDKHNDPANGATHYAFVFFDELVPDAVYLIPAHVVSVWPKTQIKRADLEGHPDVARIPLG